MTIQGLACLLALAIVAACEAPAGGAWPRQGVADRKEAKPSATAVTASDLRLHASVERDSFLVGEPVYLELRLENTGRQSHRVFGSLDPSDGAVEVLVMDPNGREHHFVPLVETEQDESIMVDLGPSAAVGAVAPVFFGANGWTFPSPGRYGVTAVYRTKARDAQVMEVRSAVLNVEVRASADGAGEFLAGGSPPSLEAGKFLTWQAGDHLTAGRAHLENLLTRYPRSDLTHYALSALSRSEGTRFLDYRSRTVRAPNCELALARLRGVVDERLPGYVRMQNALTRARCAVRARDIAGARAAIGDVRGMAGERPEYQGLVAQATELERSLSPQGRQ
jgi:hypothetical protein